MENNYKELEVEKQVVDEASNIDEQADATTINISEQDVNALKNELEDYKNKYLRTLADNENIRKNYIKKEHDLHAYRYEPLMSEMLDLLDDIDRGMEADEFSAGGLLIMSKLQKVLTSFGLEKIKIEENTEFDSNDMEAVSIVTVPDMSGKVVACPTVGYKYNGKVIRYPKVVVGQ